MVEELLPTPDIPGLNPSITKRVFVIGQFLIKGSNNGEHMPKYATAYSWGLLCRLKKLQSKMREAKVLWPQNKRQGKGSKLRKLKG